VFVLSTYLVKRNIKKELWLVLETNLFLIVI